MFAKQVDDGLLIWSTCHHTQYQTVVTKYLLTVIDVFSKYGWIVSLKTKTGKEVAIAFQKLFTDNAAPSILWTDKGTKFYNQQVKSVLTANTIALYGQLGEIKRRGTMEQVDEEYNVEVLYSE